MKKCEFCDDEFTLGHQMGRESYTAHLLEHAVRFLSQLVKAQSTAPKSEADHAGGSDGE